MVGRVRVGHRGLNKPIFYFYYRIFTFYYNGKPYQTKFCICTKFLQVKSNAKFYPSIKYLYCELEEFLPNENLVVFAENQKVYITEEEFKKNFIDLREYNINLIIN